MSAAAPLADAPPPPLIEPEYAAFYNGIEQGRLVIQHCDACCNLQHPPAPVCTHCDSLDLGTRACSGRGTLYSYTVHHYPPLLGFPTPHAIILADMDDGFRLVGALAHGRIDDLQIGAPIVVRFGRHADGQATMYFELESPA